MYSVGIPIPISFSLLTTLNAYAEAFLSWSRIFLINFSFSSLERDSPDLDLFLNSSNSLNSFWGCKLKKNCDQTHEVMPLNGEDHKFPHNV